MPETKLCAELRGKGHEGSDVWEWKEGRCLGFWLMQHAVICSRLLKTCFINLIGWKRLLFFFANYSDSWISGPRHYVYKPLVFHLYFDLPGWTAPGEGPIGQAGPTDRKKNDPKSLAGNRVLTSIRCKLRTKLTSKVKIMSEGSTKSRHDLD